MTKPKQDLTGRTFGRLKVLSQDEDYILPKTGKHVTRWLCQCSCPNQTITSVSTGDLNSGHSQSCGCLAREITANRMRKGLIKYDLSGEYGIGWTSNTKVEFYFDLEDFDKIKDRSWSENSHGYIVSYQHIGFTHNTHSVGMHNLVTGLKFTDHINRNRKDNRKQNLRESNLITNARNFSKHKNNTSGFTGITWSKPRQTWCAQIRYNNINYYLGSSDIKEEALLLRLQAEYEFFTSDWAPQRDLFEQYNIPNQEIHQKLVEKGVIKE